MEDMLSHAILDYQEKSQSRLFSPTYNANKWMSFIMKVATSEGYKETIRESSIDPRRLLRGIINAIADGAEKIGKTRVNPEIQRNAGAVELTTGCSLGCSFCGFSAPQLGAEKLGVLDIFSMAEDSLNTNVFLYWGSDPFDWEQTLEGETYSYADLHRTLKYLYPRLWLYVSTAIPKGKENLVWENRDVVNRVSLSKWNRTRLKRILGDRLQNLPTLHMDRRINSDLTQLKGKNLWEGNSGVTEGIGCFDGAVITPTGAKSILQLTNNQTYKECQISVPLLSWLDQVRKLSRQMKCELPKTEDELDKLARVLSLPRPEALLSVAVPRYKFWTEFEYDTRARVIPNGRPVEVTNMKGEIGYYLFSPSGKEVRVCPQILD